MVRLAVSQLWCGLPRLFRSHGTLQSAWPLPMLLCSTVWGAGPPHALFSHARWASIPSSYCHPYPPVHSFLPGANLDVDISYQWLRFFMQDDARLEEIGRDYGAGRLLTGQVKAELVGVLAAMVERHQAARAAVSDAVVDAFMTPRAMPDLFPPRG